MELRTTLAFPTRYRFGWGRRAELADEAKRAGIARALIVTDRGVAAQPWFAAMADALGGRVFDAISSNPTEAELRAAIAACDACDGVVAIGGGAAMDVGKLVGLDVKRPVVCVPTTSGTGSELSTGAVIAAPDKRVKRTILNLALMPRAVIADPELTVGLPPHLTAATGMDALTHAIEALCVPAYNPLCDAVAREAIALIVEHLPTAVRRPDDVAARSHMMMASSLAAVAFQKGLGLCHAMAHPLGAVANVHHGLANAVLLPHVLDHNAAAIDVDVRGLAARCGLPSTLPRGDADLDELTRLALAETIYLATNPRPVTADAVAAIYRAVLTG